MAIDQETKRKMRRVFRRLKEKFPKSETKTELLKLIVIKGFGKVNLIEEYYKMADWAEDKKEKPSVRRFSFWITKAIEWGDQRKEKEPDTEKLKTALAYEEERSRERIKAFRAGRE